VGTNDPRDVLKGLGRYGCDRLYVMHSDGCAPKIRLPMQDWLARIVVKNDIVVTEEGDDPPMVTVRQEPCRQESAT
jgi:hypothetical protein